MSAVFRAVDEPAVSRPDYWQHAIQEHLVPMEVRLHDGPDLRDELVVGEIGALRVAEWSSGPGETNRTTRHIRRADPGDVYQLFVAVDGRVVGEQNGRRNELAPGDIGAWSILRVRCVACTMRTAACWSRSHGR